jgi:hypothetical protein
MDASLPVTETGYRSHFCHESRIEPYGSALACVQVWQDHEAIKPEWQSALETALRLSLI